MKAIDEEAVRLREWWRGMSNAIKLVEALARNYVGNTRPDGTRDSIIYEQGIGMELAVKELIQEQSEYRGFKE